MQKDENKVVPLFKKQIQVCLDESMYEILFENENKDEFLQTAMISAQKTDIGWLLFIQPVFTNIF
jgi:hypothetical protein